MINNNRFNNTKYVLDDNSNKQKGVIFNINYYKTLPTKTYKIPLEFNYRPDLISNYFYGTSKYSWLISFVNDITDSPQGFYSGREIYIPYKEGVV